MPDATATATLLYGVCGAVYLALAALILLQVPRRMGRAPAGRTGISFTGALLAAAAGVTAAWAASAALRPAAPLDGLPGNLDLLRALIWYGFALHLFRASFPDGADDRRTGPAAIFTVIGALALAAVIAAMLSGHGGMGGVVSLASPGVALRLALAVCQLLLLENLYRNTRTDLRWNVNLACVGLGGLAIFDLALCADAVLFHHATPAFVGGRAVVAVLVCPLLALAAARNRNWSVNIHVSRSAALHTASLVISGLFLLAVAAAGEIARRIGAGSDGHWGGVAQISLLFAGVLTVAVLLTSGSARSLLRFLLIDHFFSNRYDYRQEWMRCIETLSDEAAEATLHRRVVRALAQVVDSPAGLLLLREPEALGLHWVDSWNMPPLTAALAPGHPLLTLLEGAEAAAELGHLTEAHAPLDAAWNLWLAIPLRHGGRLAGCVLLADPRAPFRLDREVFDLLRILAREVATYLAEQRATRVLLETRELRAYGERFAFVAHDIKNVSSQLSLLLSNAETHIANPDFQRDMLLTVGASVQKIGALIRRLQTPEQEAPSPTARTIAAGAPSMAAIGHLERVAAQMRRLRNVVIALEHDGGDGLVPLDPSVFETIVTHLLDNALEAIGPDGTVRLRVRHEAARVVVDIIDTGPGMTPEFIRDQLFRPFRTSKQRGSGIGAFQARALLRAASGDLLVASRPGVGTTMRLLLPLVAPEAVKLSA